MLESLHLNRNQISILTPIQQLKSLRNLQMYHNRVSNKAAVMQIIPQLPKLKELALDGNPCATTREFNFELICRIPKLKALNDDTVKELDRDVAF